METFVVIGNSSTILSNPQHDELFIQKVFHADLLHEKLDKLFSNMKRKPISPPVIHRIHHELKSQKVKRFDDVFAKVNISREQLVPGVVCEKCWRHRMVKCGHTWHCEHCNHLDKKAYEQAIYDYFLLHDMKPVTNGELRQFLHIPSRHIAYPLLKQMNFKMTRAKRHALYHAPSLDHFPQYAKIPTLF